MNYWAVFNAETGHILSTHRGGFSNPPDVPEGCGIVSAPANLSLDYVKNGTVTRRPALQAYACRNVLYGVPKGAEIYIEDECYISDGTEVAVQFDIPGVYLALIKCWPYLDSEVELSNGD